METFRSEYSEDGLLSTSRFGGSSTSAASLTFSSQSGSRSARSDFLTSYELKFQARKAEKEKKKNKEREAVASNQTSSAEEKWRAEREADRAVRKREMETWIPKPTTLKRVEQDSKKRSRERMKRVLSWYPPVDSADGGGEVHPQFATRGLLADGGKDERVLTEHSRVADDAARHAVANALQRRVTDLRLKVAFVEHQHQVLSAHPASASPTRASSRQKMRTAIRQRRLGREQLAPLRGGRDDEQVGDPNNARLPLTCSTSHAAIGGRDARVFASGSGRSQALRNCAAAYPTGSTLGSRAALGHSGSKSMSRLAVVGEDADEQADDAETAQFLLLHRQQVRRLCFRSSSILPFLTRSDLLAHAPFPAQAALLRNEDPSVLAHVYSTSRIQPLGTPPTQGAACVLPGLGPFSPLQGACASVRYTQVLCCMARRGRRCDSAPRGRTEALPGRRDTSRAPESRHEPRAHVHRVSDDSTNEHAERPARYSDNDTAFFAWWLLQRGVRERGAVPRFDDMPFAAHAHTSS